MVVLWTVVGGCNYRGGWFCLVSPVVVRVKRVRLEVECFVNVSLYMLLALWLIEEGKEKEVVRKELVSRAR